MIKNEDKYNTSYDNNDDKTIIIIIITIIIIMILIIDMIDMSVPSDSNISAKSLKNVASIKIWKLKLLRSGKRKQKPYQLL